MLDINRQDQTTLLRTRFITASSLFDGHDASINIVRRILQSAGVEVIHLGHNRSVQEIVNAALQEDVQAIAISSYQGGHVEFFKYMIDMLKQHEAEHIRVFAGGGGVITAEEISELENYGVTRIYTPQQGQQLGLKGMIDNMLAFCDTNPPTKPGDSDNLQQTGHYWLPKTITAIENGTLDTRQLEFIQAQALKLKRNTPVIGITGTGGSGKSSLTDELILRFRLLQQDRLKIAILAVDPSRSKSNGALLGDRIRMNAINHPDIFFRSIATRHASALLPDYLGDMISACKACGFDFIIVETPGTGQGDTAIVPLASRSIYVMTAEFGAQSQLEKIDMLDYADFVVINKFDKKGAVDALHDVAKQYQRNHELFATAIEDMPVYGTTASHFNDAGVTALYYAIVNSLLKRGNDKLEVDSTTPEGFSKSCTPDVIVPSGRSHYLAEIAQTVRDYTQHCLQQAKIAGDLQHLTETRRLLNSKAGELTKLDNQINTYQQLLDTECVELLESWSDSRQLYLNDNHENEATTHTSLSGLKIPRVALPEFSSHADLLKWLMLENVPGQFPFTSGVFAFKRQSEDPTRMFAGEGDAFRTNKRFKKLSEHSAAKRLSTAFDSVTLYGCDPDERPDIYGKIGNSGVSIATLDDMKVLYQGFDLCSPNTSVSMTINGPAPAILAMFLNTAIDQQLQKFEIETKRKPTTEETEHIKSTALQNVRGTVQADILKEDQGQNTCIFSTRFSLRMMADIQQYFVDQQIRKFYSVSISGYHIAEAGANPITQLALTLSNGFTYVESYLARGMKIDDFATNLSFFFSNGMEPEYSVMGRVARRIWAITMRDKYAANERSQKLKYHIQTSGRSLHAEEMDFNDIRTTLQALIAIYDNCNSLHTNAFDEAVTTPTEASVRRALAIQLIINHEWGLSMNENPNQGAFIINELTELVEQAVLQEFERLSERGGVLGAMETGYQRAKIQQESLLYENRKHDGSLPIIGVNRFINAQTTANIPRQLARSTTDEKNSQIRRLKQFKKSHQDHSAHYLNRLRQAALNNQNIFNELMETVRYCSLGQISQLFFEVGGQYRRSM